MIRASAATLLPVVPVPSPVEGDGAEGAAAQPFVAVLAAALAAPMVVPPAMSESPVPAVSVAADDVISDEAAEESMGETMAPVISAISGEDAAIVAPESARAAATEPMRTVVRAATEQDVPPAGESPSSPEPAEAASTEPEPATTDDAVPGAPVPSSRAEATPASAVVAASVAMSPPSRGGSTGQRQHGANLQAESPRMVQAESPQRRERAASPTAGPQGADVAAARGTAAGVLAALSDRNAALLEAADRASPKSVLAGLVAPSVPPVSTPVPGPALAIGATMPEGAVLVQTSEGDPDEGPVPSGPREPLLVSARAGEVAQVMEPSARAVSQGKVAQVVEPPARAVTDGEGEPRVAAALAPPSRRPAEVEQAVVSVDRPAEPQPSPRLPWVATASPAAHVTTAELPPRAAPERTPVRVTVPSPSFVTVELDPETSGAQRVRVAVRGDAVHATVVTDPGGAEAMRPQLGELRQALEGQGFREATVQLRTTGDAAMATPIAAGQDVRGRGESGPASDGQPGDPHARGRQRGQDHQPPGQGRRPDPEEEMA